MTFFNNSSLRKSFYRAAVGTALVGALAGGNHKQKTSLKTEPQASLPPSTSMFVQTGEIKAAATAVTHEKSHTIGASAFAAYHPPIPAGPMFVNLVDENGTDDQGWEERMQATLSDSAYRKQMTDILSKMDHDSTATLLTKLQDVNAFVNKRITYMTDSVNYGTQDYWATPFESLTGRHGDCEDYAIAKYYILNYLGVPADRMAITGVMTNNKVDYVDHMILLVDTSAQKNMKHPVVLENYDDGSGTLEQFKWTGYKPVYILNRNYTDDPSVYLTLKPQVIDTLAGTATTGLADPPSKADTSQKAEKQSPYVRPTARMIQ